MKRNRAEAWKQRGVHVIGDAIFLRRILLLTRSLNLYKKAPEHLDSCCKPFKICISKNKGGEVSIYPERQVGRRRRGSRRPREELKYKRHSTSTER